MNPYFGNIEKLMEENTNFRHVLFTGQNTQLVVMRLAPPPNHPDGTIHKTKAEAQAHEER